MAWRRKKKRADAEPSVEHRGAGPRRRRFADGTVEIQSAVLGREFIVPADPRPRKIDLSADAPGWERLREFARRLWGG